MKKEVLIKAIEEYRSIGRELMTELAKKFDLDINTETDFERLISKTDNVIPRSGFLTKKWQYFFHGMECGFRNIKTKQSVEVVLKNSPHFGVLNAWFLLNFMKSSEIYSDLVNGISWQDLEGIINELYRDNLVVEIK